MGRFLTQAGTGSSIQTWLRFGTSGSCTFNQFDTPHPAQFFFSFPLKTLIVPYNDNVSRQVQAYTAIHLINAVGSDFKIFQSKLASNQTHYTYTSQLHCYSFIQF